MKIRRISDKESLFRHCIHPKAFRGKGKTSLAIDNLFYFKRDETGDFLASLAWQRYLPTRSDVIDSGCRLAQRMNQREGKRADDKLGDRRVFCGSYQFYAHSVRALPSADGLQNLVYADLIHHPEDGEVAHVDFIIRICSMDALDIATTKTAILDRLWNQTQGPIAECCSCDTDLLPGHPMTFLRPAPNGEYEFNTAPLSLWISLFRLWLTTRFVKNWEP